VPRVQRAWPSPWWFWGFPVVANTYLPLALFGSLVAEQGGLLSTSLQFRYGPEWFVAWVVDPVLQVFGSNFSQYNVGVALLQWELFAGAAGVVAYTCASLLGLPTVKKRRPSPRAWMPKVGLVIGLYFLLLTLVGYWRTHRLLTQRATTAGGAWGSTQWEKWGGVYWLAILAACYTICPTILLLMSRGSDPRMSPKYEVARGAPRNAEAPPPSAPRGRRAGRSERGGKAESGRKG
jgi:hypothetical protein